jgi:serine/threonine protein kinase
MHQYKIVQQIGAGSFGSVFFVIYNSQLDCLKKITLLDQNSYQAVQQEINVWQNLHHPNIVQYYNCFIERNQFCILIEIVEGPNFEQFLLAHPNLTEDFILNLFFQLLSALKYSTLTMFSIEI